ncbi:MAG TPA: energy transducer TonB [Polyangia bacterium]
MRRAAIATGVSVAAHAIALFSLARPSLRSTRPGGVTVAIVDPRASDDATGSAAAAPTAPTTHEPADLRPTPRARRSRVARVDPSPAPSAEPLPIAPDGDAAATDDAAPGSTAPTAPSTAPPGPPAPSPAPARARGEPRPPGLDRDTCIDHVDYPWRARLLDKEGMVRLRVVLGADGRVQSATVVQRAGWGFDETAVAAVKTRCRFTPAYDAAGHPVPFVIENYHFYFRLDDFDPQARMRRWEQRW